MKSERPRGLKETTWIMAILNLFGYVIVDWDAHPVLLALSVAGVSLLILAGYVVLWFYWHGKNWARRMVLLTSLLALMNLMLWSSAYLAERIMIALEAPLALFLLYWLNTPRAKTYFVAPLRTLPLQRPVDLPDTEPLP